MNNLNRIGHDRLFKELLLTFFGEFMELFFPEVYEVVDFNDIHFLQQEVYTDVTVGEKHIVDILVKTKLKGEEGLILIHVENQAQVQEEFAKSMDDEDLGRRAPLKNRKFEFRSNMISHACGNIGKAMIKFQRRVAKEPYFWVM